MKNSIINCVTAYNYQIISLILFSVGLIGTLTAKNFIKVFISLEFIVNAINILFVSFSSYKYESAYLGYFVAIYITAISALLLAIGLYFTYFVYKKFNTIEIEKVYAKYKDVKKC